MREAAQELDLLLDVVRYAKDDTADDGEIVDCNICLLSKVSVPKLLRLCDSEGGKNLSSWKKPEQWTG